jgi:chemotaxis protein methyltransferase CheR
VCVAENGRIAREILDREKFDLITLDIHMPEMDGIAFLKQAYQKSDPPVLMVSSVQRSDQDLAMQAITLGAADYVQKPEFSNLDKSRDEILSKAKILLSKGTPGLCGSYFL